MRVLAEKRGLRSAYSILAAIAKLYNKAIKGVIKGSVPNGA